jgi:hypothetical protein
LIIWFEFFYQNKKKEKRKKKEIKKQKRKQKMSKMTDFQIKMMKKKMKKLEEENKKLKEKNDGYEALLRCECGVSIERVVEIKEENKKLKEENERLKIPDGVVRAFKGLVVNWWEDGEKYYSENFDVKEKYDDDPGNIPTKYLSDCNYTDLRILNDWIVGGKYDKYEIEESSSEEEEEEDEETEKPEYPDKDYECMFELDAYNMMRGFTDEDYKNCWKAKLTGRVKTYKEWCDLQ